MAAESVATERGNSRSIRPAVVPCHMASPKPPWRRQRAGGNVADGCNAGLNAVADGSAAATFAGGSGRPARRLVRGSGARISAALLLGPLPGRVCAEGPRATAASATGGHQDREATVRRINGENGPFGIPSRPLRWAPDVQVPENGAAHHQDEDRQDDQPR
jgi:hypothetical protein